VSQLHLQPGHREIVGQDAADPRAVHAVGPGAACAEQRLEDYIVHALVDFDDIDYFTHADLLYDLAGQMVKHLQSYLSKRKPARNVLDRDRR
jgi:type III restriction enzyme